LPLVPLPASAPHCLPLIFDAVAGCSLRCTNAPTPPASIGYSQS
jgi:hypothetical protein